MKYLTQSVNFPSNSRLHSLDVEKSFYIKVLLSCTILISFILSYSTVLINYLIIKYLNAHFYFTRPWTEKELRDSALKLSPTKVYKNWLFLFVSSWSAHGGTPWAIFVTFFVFFELPKSIFTGTLGARGFFWHPGYVTGESRKRPRYKSYIITIRSRSFFFLPLWEGRKHGMKYSVPLKNPMSNNFLYKFHLWTDI